MIRIPEPRREVILKFMEMGAAEILLPQTEPVEQAKALVDCAMYAPFGNRGVSLLRVHTRYEKISENVRFVYAAIGG
jgi:2-keto-3-deoxy-L-rhamnonate aldolase RhmA